MTDKLKKLTGKNPKDFNQVAFDLINSPDVNLFKELVDNDDFLFDFVKDNVSERINRVCNDKNYINLLSFFDYYSPSYEDVIVSNLIKYANEDLTDKILEIFETGSDNAKTYCAKYFSYINDPLALDLLRKFSYSDNQYLSSNCAYTLSCFGDRESYKSALLKINCADEFEKLSAIKFLCSYGDKAAVPFIIDSIKHSSMPENIAGELLYLTDLLTIANNNLEDALFVYNWIISGLGEILPLSQVYDFRLYEMTEFLLSKKTLSSVAVALLNANDKFETLTENEEYLFDESKDIKNEIKEIKKLFNNLNIEELKNLAKNEISADSLFTIFAMDFAYSEEKVRALLNSKNTTLLLKSLDTLKQNSNITESDKSLAIKNISDPCIINIINAM